MEEGPQVVIGLTDPPEPTLIEESRETLSIETRESRPTRSRPSLSPESQRALSIEPPPVSVPEPDPFSEPLLEAAPISVRASSEPLLEAALVTPDEMSIPPVGDLAVEPVAEKFFSDGELSDHHEDTHDGWDPSKDKVLRKAEPHVVERRARFSRYVTWAVGGAAIVCLAALIRTTTHAAAPAPAPKAVAVAEPAVPAVAAAAAAPPVVKEEPVAPVQKAAEPPAAPAPEAVETPKVDVPAAAPAADAKSALQEKTDCRKSLERGKLADAIAAGERAVALDAEDGEAWLLLGASYQEKGNAAEARRAYTSCVKEGKRGPVGECRQMLR